MRQKDFAFIAHLSWKYTVSSAETSRISSLHLHSPTPWTFFNNLSRSAAIVESLCCSTERCFFVTPFSDAYNCILRLSS